MTNNTAANATADPGAELAPRGNRTPGTLRTAAGKLRALLRGLLSAGDERGQAKRNAVTAFAVRVASAALLYLTQVLLARWMGSFEYGIYVFVWTWVLVLGGISSLGLNLAAIRLVPEYRETGNAGLLRGLVLAGSAVSLTTGTVIAALGLAGLWLSGDALASYYVLPAYLALVCIPLYALSDLGDGLGRGHGWMGLGLVPPYILRPLLLLGLMVAAHEVGLEMSAVTAASAAIVATWLTAATQMLLIGRRIAATTTGARPALAPREWLLTSWPLLVMLLCELALQTTDILVVSQVMSPHDVAVYFAAAKTMSLIMFVHYAVGSAVGNRFSALKARGDRQGLEAFARDAVAWTFWPSLAAGTALLALGLPLLWLFGPEFTSGYPVMAILVGGFLARAAVGPTEFMLNMLGHQRTCAAALAVAATLNIALSLFLVPRLGLTGAALANATAITTSAVIQYIAVRRLLGLDVGIWRQLTRRPTLATPEA